MKKNSREEKKEKFDGIKPEVYQKRWKILATLCTSLLLVTIGNSSLNLALPTLAKDLSLSTIQLTWVVDIYSLFFASLLFTTSSVADRYGRKIILQLGLLVFFLATFYTAFIAKTGTELIIMRAIMGIGGAMVMPTTLSILDNVFPRSERAQAIAIWSGIAGGGIALGSIISGFLLEHFSWQSIFILSVLIGGVGFISNQFLTPNSRDEKETPIDWIGGIFSIAGLLGLVYGIIEAPSHGLLHPEILISLSVGALGIISFIFWQLRSKHPMLDIKLFKIPAFSISALSVTLTFFALMGIFFSMSQLFQLILGYGTIESSLRLLPISFLMIFISPFVPKIVKRIGTRWTVTSGLTLVAFSFFIMSHWPVHPSYLSVIISMSIMMCGMAFTMTPATNMLMSAIPRNRAGMGSAMNDTTRELGGTLGVAVLGSVLSSGYANKLSVDIHLPEKLQKIAESSLTGALAIAKEIGPNGDKLIIAAKTAWMGGLSEAMLIASGIVAAAAIIAAIWLPHKPYKAEDDSLTQE